MIRPTPPEIYMANMISNAIQGNAGQDVIDDYVDEMIHQLIGAAK